MSEVGGVIAMKLPSIKVPVELAELHAQHKLIEACQVIGDRKLIVKKALAAQRLAAYRRRHCR
jgi:hypothetical protein